MTAALNERFRQQAAREALQNSLTAALAGTEPEASLPTVEARLRALQERQNELLRLVMSAGVDCTDYDEELQRINEAKAALTAKQAELERKTTLPPPSTAGWRSSPEPWSPPAAH